MHSTVKSRWENLEINCFKLHPYCFSRLPMLSQTEDNVQNKTMNLSKQYGAHTTKHMILLLSLSLHHHHHHLLADISTFPSKTPLVSLLRIYPDPFSLSFLADQLREGLEVLWFILQARTSLPILLRYPRSQDTNPSPPFGL